jgi:mannose-6-phosphate isomerase-like protein (cupin superfamily)
MGKCIIDGIEYKVEKGDVIVVPEGFEHNVINTSSAEVLKMVTIYAPPNYKDGIINPTKKDAEVNDIEYY